MQKNLKKSFSPLTDKKKIAYIKDKKWIYEREFRMVFDKSEEKYLIHDKDEWYFPVEIKTIYFGVNFEKNAKEVRTELLNLCLEKKIEKSKSC